MNKFDIEDLDSDNIKVVVNCLGSLSVISHDNAAMMTQSVVALVLMSLGELLETINPYCDMIFDNDFSIDKDYDLKRKTNTWPSKFRLRKSYILDAYLSSLNDNTVLLLILNIIRNLAYEPLHESLISSSTVILKQLRSIIVACSYSDLSLSEPCQISFEILVNVAAKVRCIEVS